MGVGRRAAGRKAGAQGSVECGVQVSPGVKASAALGRRLILSLNSRSAGL